MAEFPRAAVRSDGSRWDLCDASALKSCSKSLRAKWLGLMLVSYCSLAAKRFRTQTVDQGQ